MTSTTNTSTTNTALTGQAVETEAANLVTKINNLILENWDSWAALETRARIEMLCEEHLGPAWDYEIIQPIGDVPNIIITAYDPRKAIS